MTNRPDLPGWQREFRNWLHAAGLLAPPPRGAVTLADPELLPLTLCRLAPGMLGPLAVAVADTAAAERLAAALRTWLELAGDPRPVRLLPSAGQGSRRQWLPENEAARAAALDAARQGVPTLFVATAGALLDPAPPPRLFAERLFELRAGTRDWTPESLAARLIEMDYDHEPEVRVPGEFARRGGILDLFSPAHPDPLRIEFFGDTIESLRFFSAETQRSLRTTDQARVTLRGNLPPATPQKSGATATFLDYLPATAPLLVCLPNTIRDHLERFAPPETMTAWNHCLASRRPQVRLVPADETIEDAKDHVGATLLKKGAPQTPSQNFCSVLRIPQAAPVVPSVVCRTRLPAKSAKETKRFDGGFGNRLSSKGGSQLPAPVDAASLRGLFGADLAALGPGAAPWRHRETGDLLRRWQADGFRLVAFASTPGDADRLRELFTKAEPFHGLNFDLHQAALDAGVWLPGPKLVFLADHELLGRHPAPPAGRAGLFHAAPATGDDTPELEEGAAAVHAAHGICLFHGIHEIETAGRRQEAMELEFADKERLFVPLDQIHLVSRYIGGTRHAPKLSRLRGAGWRHARDAAAGAAMDLAAELLRIAACREHATGQPFPDQGTWEHSFAQAFPYAETHDQARAITDVLADMAVAKPMDRLLCGDAGYGKTEVAMRAAFRAVLAGKQVAVLVPTTVLAQQHERTFRERMAEYPVRIEMLSRFRTHGEQKKILAAAAAGQVDILIGTHRLLQPDVAFADLGLVVIDEEQRFGVEHKERFKFLRGNVDVLTMTATPIPRTLYFGLAGLRHLSTIVTPPVDRLPVSTIIAHDEDALVREALRRELDRGGQAFFLHNRVQGISQVAERLRRLLPDARLAVGHGQMPGSELEEVMTRFVNGEVDILLCTTIIESGLDIPNANTIIIDRADRFGLAELYQLRGRVGRYHNQAYAYLLLPPHGALPDNARQRLAAIRRYTHQGAGFKLALRDLEIRGAGNILGAEQSGHIAAVGFDLYCQLLREATAHLEHRPPPIPPDLPVAFDTVVSALHDRQDRLGAAIPPEYIAEESHRLDLHRRLRAITDPAAIDPFADELRDRFGAPPPPVRALLELARLRLLANRAGLLAVAVRDGVAHLETPNGLWKGPGQRLPRLHATTPLEQMCELRTLLERLARPPRKPGA